MSGLWSAQQREWLQAMGHSVLSLAGDEAEPVAAMEPRAPAASPSATAAGAVAAPARNAAAAAGSGPADSPLLRNLLRAARRAPGDAAVLALFDAAALRGDPAAKRALWPRLRALRRGNAPR